MAYTLRQMRRQGLNFLQQHEDWVKKAGARANDRSIHEHAALSRSLQFLLSYDQLNIVNLAGAEAMARRLTRWEKAPDR